MASGCILTPRLVAGSPASSRSCLSPALPPSSSCAALPSASPAANVASGLHLKDRLKIPAFDGLHGACKLRKSHRTHESPVRRKNVGHCQTWKQACASLVNGAGIAAPAGRTYEIASMEDILAERDACGVGFIANLKNKASFEVVQDALTALSCMEHRGGCGADNDSGDGAGVMTRIPWELFDHWFKEQGKPPVSGAKVAVGMVFLPQDEQLQSEALAGECYELRVYFG